jgi:hypothetical protein
MHGDTAACSLGEKRDCADCETAVYRVHYALDDGTTFPDSPDGIDYQADFGAALANPGIPTRPGSIFVGWSLLPNELKRVEFGAPVLANTKIYPFFILATRVA